MAAFVPAATGTARPRWVLRDGLWAVAFALHFPLLYAPLHDLGGDPKIVGARAGSLIWTTILGSGAGLVWFYVCWNLAQSPAVKRVFVLSHTAAVAVLSLLALVTAALASFLLALIPAAVAIGDIVWMRRAKDRTVFVAEILQLIARLLRGRGDILSVVLLLAVLQCGFLILFSQTFSLIAALDTSGAIVATIACLISFRWTVGFIKHTLSCVVATAVTQAIADAAQSSAPPRVRTQLATLTTPHYLTAFDESGPSFESPHASAHTSGNTARRSGDDAAFDDALDEVEHSQEHAAGDSAAQPAVSPPVLPHQNALASVGSALTASAGSIARGSLLGFASPVMWACRRGARAAQRRARTPCQATIARHLFTLFDSYLRISHKYAYVTVATQSRPWAAAATSTWNGFARNGVDAIIDDDVTDRLLLAGGYVGGGVLCLLLGMTVSMPTTSSWLLLSFITFAVGFVCVTLPLTVFEASMSTILVTYSQVPESLSVLHPIVAHRFSRLAEMHLHAQQNARVASISEDQDNL